MNAATMSLNPELFPANATAKLLDEHEAATRTNASNDGRSFQNEIEKTLGAYQSRRTAMLRKVDPPVSIIWPFDRVTGKKVQRVIFKANPWLDYAGTWTARHGRALMVEVKSTATHRLRVNGKSGGVTSEQMAMVRGWRLSAAAVCVLWKYNNRVTLWTPEMLAEVIASGEKSAVFESGLPVPNGTGSLIWDFLPVLERAIWPPQQPPGRIEVAYRERTIYFGPGGWSCDAANCTGARTVEAAMRAIDLHLACE